jgi:hypothetical protein
MKLEYFIEKQRIVQINAALPAGARWPSLHAVLNACDQQMPMFSEHENKEGIFIGWGWAYPHEGDVDRWLYHHTITSAFRDAGLDRFFGFHYDSAIEAVRSGKIKATPVFSVGKVAESAKFARILRSIGVKAYVNMPPLTSVEPYERNSNHRHTRVLR